MINHAVHPAWCVIDLGAFSHNVLQVRSIVGSGVRIFACLKGDALGCGAEQIAIAAEAAGVDGLTFADAELAIACRDKGVTLPMLIYPGPLAEAAGTLGRYGLMPSLSTLEDVRDWSKKARSNTKVFLKLDGGGLRAGALPAQAAEVARAIVQSGNLVLAGVYGHPMVSYGFDDGKFTEAQINILLETICSLATKGLSGPVRMISSSATLLEFPRADLNAVDPGRLLLGMFFPSLPERGRKWKPALAAIRARIVMKKAITSSDEVPQAPFFQKRPECIGLIPLGWGDGFPRKMPAEASVLIRGRRVKLVGPAHLELLRVDLTDIPDAEVGDEVTLLGQSGTEEISIGDICTQWGVDELDIYTGICRRLPKVYLNR